MRVPPARRRPHPLPAEARSPSLSPLPLRRSHLRAPLPLELVRHLAAHPVLHRDDHPGVLRPAPLSARLPLLQAPQERRQRAALPLRAAPPRHRPVAHLQRAIRHRPSHRRMHESRLSRANCSKFRSSTTPPTKPKRSLRPSASATAPSGTPSCTCTAPIATDSRPEP